MTSGWFVALALALGEPQSPPADEGGQEPRVTLEADGWYAAPSGWIFITRGSRPGTATRARQGSAFGLDPELLPVGKATFRFWESSAVGFQIVSAEESGTRAAERDFVYHGETYAAGRRVRAEAGFLLVDLDYQYAWRATPELTVTAHAGAEYWGFSSRLRTVDARPLIDERRDFSSGYWLAGMDARARLPAGFGLNFSLLGGTNGADRYFVEAEAGACLDLAGSLRVKLGYRVHEVRFHTSTNEANLLFFGPSAGLELRF